MRRPWPRGCIARESVARSHRDRRSRPGRGKRRRLDAAHRRCFEEKAGREKCSGEEASHGQRGFQRIRSHRREDSHFSLLARRRLSRKIQRESEERQGAASVTLAIFCARRGARHQDRSRGDNRGLHGVACAAVVSYVDVMPKNTWWIASLLASFMLIGAAAFYAKQQKDELAKTRAEMESLRRVSEETGAQAERLLKGLEESKERIEKLMLEKEAVTKAQRDLESQMRTALESKDVTISELQGKLTVNILDRILFDSGEAVLKPEGQAVLDQVAGVLTNYPNRQILVIGHTDNVPIRYNPNNPFKNNWDL